MGGNYIEFNINRDEIARYGLAFGDVQDVLEVALGGMPLTTTVEGLERYTVNLRYDRDFRENLEALREIIVPTPSGAQIPLGQLAKIERRARSDGHQERRRRAQRLDLRGREEHRHRHLRPDGAARGQRSHRPSGAIQLPSGYSIFWSGQYEYMLRAQQRLHDRGAAHPADHHPDHLPEHALGHQDGDRACWPCPSRWSARSGCFTCSATT